MTNQRKPQQSTRTGDLVMQQSLALRSFLGARAKRRAAQKAAQRARPQVERAVQRSSGADKSI